MPSTVVTDLPAAASAGIRQLTTGEQGREALQVRVGGFGAVEGHVDASPELAYGPPQYEPLPAAHPPDHRDTLRGIETGIFLVEVAALPQMFGKQLLDMWGAVQRCDQMGEPCGDLSHENVGETAAILLLGVRCRGLGDTCVLVKPLDDGAEQRLLGIEMMIQRLPRQPRGLGRLFDRRATESMPAEHGHRGIDNAVARGHLTNLTK